MTARDGITPPRATFGSRAGQPGRHRRGAARDAARLESIVTEAAQRAGARVIGAHFHHFGGEHGVTGVVLLAESHITIHVARASLRGRRRVHVRRGACGRCGRCDRRGARHAGASPAAGCARRRRDVSGRFTSFADRRNRIRCAALLGWALLAANAADVAADVPPKPPGPVVMVRFDYYEGQGAPSRAGATAGSCGETGGCRRAGRDRIASRWQRRLSVFLWRKRRPPVRGRAPDPEIVRMADGYGGHVAPRGGAETFPLRGDGAR